MKSSNRMNPGLAIAIGTSLCMIGYCVLFFHVFKSPSKKDRCMDVMGRYINNMKRLHLHPDDIDEELSKIKDCKELEQINKQLEKAVNKYNV